MVGESGPEGGHYGLHAENVGIGRPGRRGSISLSRENRGMIGRSRWSAHRENAGGRKSRRIVDACAGGGVKAEACTDAGGGGRRTGWRMKVEACICAYAGRLAKMSRVERSCTEPDRGSDAGVGGRESMDGAMVGASTRTDAGGKDAGRRVKAGACTNADAGGKEAERRVKAEACTNAGVG